MTKRLKKRIREVCGLDSLSREERILRIQEILDSVEEKQAICNQIIGTSFKDIEKALTSIKGEKPKSNDADELAKEIPDKVYPEKQSFDREMKANNLIELMDPKEVAWLVEQSTKPLEPIVTSETFSHTAHDTYSFEEVAALIEGNYHPSMFKRKRGTPNGHV